MTDDQKKTEQIRVAVSEELFARCAKLANDDNRTLSEWVRHQLICMCELHDRGLDLTVGIPRRAVLPEQYD